MLLPFVSWLYGTPSPDTPLYGLLPNTSERSRTPGENSPGFSRPRVISLQQRARVLFGDRFASKPGRGARPRTVRPNFTRTCAAACGRLSLRVI
jgi:hypothetical protein